MSSNEFELVYESKFQNPVNDTLSFDVASILINKLIVDSPSFSCRIQLYTLKKRTVFDRSTALYLGTLDFKLEDLVADNKPVDQLAPFEFENGRKKSKKVPAVTAEF